MSDTQVIDDLLKRIQVLEDKEALQALMNRYCRTADDKDWVAWGECFVDDAVFDFGPFGEHNGRDKIRDVCSAAEEPYQDMQHSMTNMQFEVDGDRATGTAYLWFAGVPDKAKPAEHFDIGGPYEWEFVRSPQGWRLSLMRLRIAWTLGQDNDAVFN